MSPCDEEHQYLTKGEDTKHYMNQAAVQLVRQAGSLNAGTVVSIFTQQVGRVAVEGTRKSTEIITPSLTLSSNDGFLSIVTVSSGQIGNPEISQSERERSNTGGQYPTSLQQN